MGGRSEVSGRRGGLATGPHALTGQPSACPLFTPLEARGGGPGLSTIVSEPPQMGLGLAPRRPGSGQPLAVALSGQGHVAASQALCCLPGPACGPGVLPRPGLRGPCCQKCAGRQLQGPPAVTPKGGREAETPGESWQVWSPHTPPTGPEAAADAGGGRGPGQDPGEEAGAAALREPGVRAGPPGRAAQRHPQAAAGRQRGQQPPGWPRRDLPPDPRP